jgi:hypothetical protein
MNTFSKIRRGACIVLLLITTLLVIWRAQSPSGEATFSNVGNTMANVGGGSYGSSYQARPDSNSDNLWCLAIGFSFGIFVTLMVTELLTKFEQACNDLALLRMKYEALCRERLAEAPPSAERRELATAGK